MTNDNLGYRLETMKMTKFRPWFCAALMTIVCYGQSFGSEIRVVVSIKPVYGLTAAIMAGVEIPALLIKGTDSVHGYQLKPSDAQLLEDADILFWIGHNLESSLIASISNLMENAEVVELSELNGLTLLPNRENPDAHDEEDHGDRDSEEEDHHGNWDMHIWLDTSNSKIMAGQIATSLQNMLPKFRNEIESNLNSVLQRLDALEAELQEIAKPIADVPYLVFHDAYQYLENSLNLNNVGAVTTNPERAPGAKKITALRQLVNEIGAVCIFSEPQFNPRILQTIAKGTGLRFGVLDPLGSEIDESVDTYFQIMRRLVNSLRECLG